MSDFPVLIHHLTGILRNESSALPYIDFPHYLVPAPDLMMRSFFCLLTFCLGVLHLAFAQQGSSANLSPFPPGSPIAVQQARLFQDFTRAQQKLYQAKIDSILALKRSYPHLSTMSKPRSATLGNSCGLHADCTPEQDTTVVTGSLTLKNTTIGADAYEWIDDSYSSFPKPNEDLVMYPPVGVAEEKNENE